MVTEETVAIAVRRILEVARPSRIIAFGSYARGDADEDSDLDLMVIEPQVDDTARELLRLYRAVGWVGAGVDLLVYSEEEFERRSQVRGTVLFEAKQTGKVVYDAASC